MVHASRNLEFSVGEKDMPCPSNSGRKRNDRAQERGTKCDVRVALITPFGVEIWARISQSPELRKGHHYIYC